MVEATTPSSDGGTCGVAWGLTPLWLLLGFIIGVLVTAVVLFVSPSRYERLRQFITSTKISIVAAWESTCCARRPRDMDDPVYNPGDMHVAGEPEAAINHNYDYSEIDMKNTLTLNPDGVQPKGQRPRQRYEDCTITRNSHTYSDCSSGQHPQQQHQQQQHPAETRDHSARLSHTYSILEPGSNKRVAVKIVTKDEKDDPNHVYFRLEPGTNKVVPRARLDTSDMKEHTYFVLEPCQDGDDVDENAYAVNDLSDNNYFILEKE